MRFPKRAAAVSMIAAGALLFSACGSDNNGGGGGTAAAPGVQCGGKTPLKASGSTAQQNAMTRFVQTYQQTCSGQDLNYTPNGSGSGVSDFTGNQTDFGGTDSGLDPTKGQPAAAQARCASPAWDLPLVFGPVAVSYNLPGVTDLALDGPTVAKLFNGGIKTWNDPAIAALNPGKNIPALPVQVSFRSDQSGTTDNFQKYLMAASGGAWGKPAGQTFNGGVGAGAAKSDGVAAAIKGAPGTVGYVEYGFAQQQQLPAASIVNSAGGQAVPLTTDNVAKAIDGVQFKGQGNDLLLDLNSIYATKTPGAYPITLATYEVVCSNYADKQTSQAVKAFLNTALSDQAQQNLATVGSVPLPQSLKQRLSAAINAIA